MALTATLLQHDLDYHQNLMFWVLVSSGLGLKAPRDHLQSVLVWRSAVLLLVLKSRLESTLRYISRVLSYRTDCWMHVSNSRQPVNWNHGFSYCYSVSLEWNGPAFSCHDRSEFLTGLGLEASGLCLGFEIRGLGHHDLARMVLFVTGSFFCDQGATFPPNFVKIGLAVFV